MTNGTTARASAVPRPRSDAAADAAPAPSGRRAETAARQRFLLPWWAELLVFGALYLAYSVGRAMVGAEPQVALDHGRDVLHLQRILWIDPEVTLNSALQSVPVLAVLACYWYSLGHYTVTPAVLVWLRLRRRSTYEGARSMLMLTTVIGLAGFWLYPTAPPRMLPEQGFTDTLAAFSQYGWWAQDASAPRGLGGITNEFAAMPSLHVAWAVWVGVHVVRSTRRVGLQIAAVVYAVVTCVVVMATANHYLLDVVAGVAVLGVAAVVVGAGRRLLRRHTVRRSAAREPGSVEVVTA